MRDRWTERLRVHGLILYLMGIIWTAGLRCIRVWASHWTL